MAKTLDSITFLFGGLAIYNALEILAMVFLTFKNYGGIYFWSLLVAASGIIPHALGYFILNATLKDGGNLIYIIFVLGTIGWWTMVTGQAFVLWSRLHLVLIGSRGQKILNWTKWMILMNILLLHVPTTVLTFVSATGLPRLVRGYSIMEKIELSGFFVQETTLSCIYIMEATKLLRRSPQAQNRTMLKQLILVNAIIIAMDLGLLILELLSLYELQTSFKSLVYSIKLKLEFAILGKLIDHVGGSSRLLAEDPSRSPNYVTLVTTTKDNSRQRAAKVPTINGLA